MAHARFKTTGSFSGYFVYQPKNSWINTMLGEMMSRDIRKVVTKQQYSGQLNRKWVTSWFWETIRRPHITFESALQRVFRPCSMHSALLGRYTRPAASHSFHKMTLVNKSWAQGMCKTSPASRPTVPAGNTAKTENSILELSLLLTSKNTIRYIQIENQRSQSKCTWGLGRRGLGGRWILHTSGAKQHCNTDTCTSHNKSRQLLSQGKKRKGGVWD